MQLPDREQLKERLEQYTDEQLLNLLQNREKYQQLAVELAEKLALQRGLQFFGRELPPGDSRQPVRFWKGIFPETEPGCQSKKMFASLLRILYLLGVFPLVLALMELSGGLHFLVWIWGLGAAVWVLTVWLVEKKLEARLVPVLIVLAAVFH
ncbi:MAG: hypothetical protein AB7D05_07500, partial [Mangrovibacterium sp.]